MKKIPLTPSKQNLLEYMATKKFNPVDVQFVDENYEIIQMGTFKKWEYVFRYAPDKTNNFQVKRALAYSDLNLEMQAAYVQHLISVGDKP